MNMKHYIALGLTLPMLALYACKKEEAPQPQPIDEPISVSITGTFHQPEWVDLDAEGEDGLRNFVLRPNAQGYPKVVLTDLENSTDPNAFEPYPTSVFLYNGSNGETPNIRLEVEDDMDRNKGHNPDVGGTNKVSGNTPAERGTSRIVKKGDKYHVLVGFETSGTRGRSLGSNAQWPATFTEQSYYVAIVLNAANRYDDNSQHRIYVPHRHPTNVDTNATGIPFTSMPPVKHTVGDYLLATPMETGKANNGVRGEGFFKMPVISHFSKVIQRTSPNKLTFVTDFYMPGVLLALRFDNRTGRDITIKKLRTRSTSIAYSGYYEFWGGRTTAGSNPKTQRAGKHSPGFARYDKLEGVWDKIRGRVYEFPILDDQGQNSFPLTAGQSSQGRFYINGGYDSKFTDEDVTLVQVEYEYQDTPGVTVYSETVSISPPAATHQGRRFKESHAYLVTVPVRTPELGNLSAAMPDMLGEVNAMNDFPQ